MATTEDLFNETFNSHEGVPEELDTYKHIVSTSIDAVALVDRDYRYRAISRTYGKIVGKQPEEVVGQRVPDIVGWKPFEVEVKPRSERCFAGEEVRYHSWNTRSLSVIPALGFRQKS